jgi:phospholipase C
VANDRKLTDRREFLQLMGLGSAAAMLNSSIAKALSIPANFKTGTINDVEHMRLLRPARGQAEER